MSDVATSSAAAPGSPAPGRAQRAAAWLGAAALLGPLALFESRASIFAVLLLIIALAALTRYAGPRRQLLRVALATSLLLAVVALVRFVSRDALPGIVAASGRASGMRAVSRLREILFAQDASRRLGLIDPDGNGVGGAGRLAELTGAAPARSGGAVLSPPPLAPHFHPRIETPVGEVAEEGDYLYVVCVPGQDGRLTALGSAAVDERAAERRFVAYAWPARADGPQKSAFFIDEYERILETANEQGSRMRLLGAERAPDCHDALEPPNQGEWSAWRGKQPRRELVGL